MQCEARADRMERAWECAQRGDAAGLAQQLAENPTSECMLVQLLKVATLNAHGCVVRLLLDAKATPNITGTTRKKCKYSKLTAFQVAVGCGHLDVAALLLEAKAQLRGTCKVRSPVWLAAKYGHATMIELLVRAGAKVNGRHSFRVPLENAARGGHLEAVQTLLGAKVRIRTRPCDDIGFLCLSAAVRGGHAHVVHALAEAKADVNDNYMFVPGTDGRMLGAGVPGAPGPGVKKWDLCKGVLVFGAVHCGQVDVLRALLQYKASMDYWRHGQTVLHMAAERGAQEDVVALACRAVSAATLNACAETGTGETALHMAVARGNVRFVRSLLRCKAHVDVGRRDTGQTPLHSALQLPLPGFGDRPSVRADVLTRILVDAKANIHKRLGPDGMAPVHLATLRTSDCGALAVLVHAKVDVNFSTYAGVTPVRVAVNHGAWHALQLLLEAKGRADVALTADGTTPLHGALRSSPGSPLVRMLVDAKADVDAADTGRGYTPVHVAVLLGRIEALRVLLKAKASADKATTRRGASPLVIAARNNCLAAAKVLFSAKADLTKASRASGDTPVQVAVSRGHVHLAALLTGSQLPF